jgi:hypothetical protein
MSEAEIQREGQYRVTEYLGILIVSALPTPDQLDAANAERLRVEKILREQQQTKQQNEQTKSKSTSRGYTRQN